MQTQLAADVPAVEAATVAPAWHMQLSVPVVESALKSADIELVFALSAPGMPTLEFPVPLAFLTPFLQSGITVCVQ